MFVESAPTRQAKMDRMAEVLADGNDLKVNSDHLIDDIREAERDALSELAQYFDGPDDVRDVELPSERLGE